MDWRQTIDPPCTCPPRPGDDECSRVEECFAAWLASREEEKK